MTKSNVLFSETTGLGDTTKPTSKKLEAKKADVCCEDEKPKAKVKKTTK